MITRIRTVVLVCLAVALTTTIATANADARGSSGGAGVVIKRWFSEGGKPQSKSSAKDLMYLVKSGEKIVFTVITASAEPLKYHWEVIKGSEVVKTSSTGNKFAWKVPSEKATWAVRVVVSDGINQKHVIWSITTSAIKTVQPAESVQRVIDSLPAEGGIVELLAGTYHPKVAIEIKKSNITVRGAGADKTKIKGLKGNTFQVAGCDDLWAEKGKDGKRGWYAPKRPPGGEYRDITVKIDSSKFIKHIRIEGMHLYGSKQKGDKHIADHGEGYRDGVYFFRVWKSTVADMEIEKTYMPISPDFSYGLMIRNNKIHNNVMGLFLMVSSGNTIEGNDVSRTTNWFGLDLNSGCQYNRIINNTFRDNYLGLKIYSASHHTEIVGNRVINVTKSMMIIYDSGHNLIARNVFANGRTGIWQWKKSYARRTHGNKIIGNVMYNMEWGICISGGASPEIFANNIIVGCKLQRLHPSIPTPGAIFGVDKKACSHNNLWQNKDGNGGYEKTTGFMSKDPLFVDPANGDFRLKSRAGRWNPKLNKWVKDKTTSPCIDAGNPKAKYAKEPKPNGSRVNMGVYGNTTEASKSPGK